MNFTQPLRTHSEESAVYKLERLSATGTAIFLSALISRVVLGTRSGDAARAFKETVSELKHPIYSIGMVLAFAVACAAVGIITTLQAYVFTWMIP
ncbi:MAG: hypothetical protein E6R15_11750 [Zoogloea sp.]|nr:MAG: hypothetical protein E6R15_11750 [Zoogloea sp.]